MLIAQAGGPCGLGFFLDGDGAGQRFSHGGGNEGFTCHFEAYARHGIGLAIMSNGDIGFELFEEIRGAVAREHAWPLAPGERLGTYVATPATLDPDPAALAACAGVYELRPLFALTVGADGASLRLTAPGQPPLTLHPISDTRFIATEIDALVTFGRDGDAPATSLTLTQTGHEQTAQRVRPVAAD